MNSVTLPHTPCLRLSCLVFQWTILLSGLTGSFSEVEIASRENDKSEDSEMLSTAESLRTNSHGGPVNKSKTILELYQKVSDKESEDQEILLNLIEKSKDKNSAENYVTIKPRITKKPKRPLTSKKPNFSVNKGKRKFKPSRSPDIDSLRRRRKRKKLIDKIKEKRKPSHMQVV